MGMNNGKTVVTIVNDINLWISAYLSFLELHYVSKEESHNIIKNSIPKKYENYKNWEHNLSVTNRRMRLLDQAEKIMSGTHYMKIFLK